jgi:hypothetical protein
MNKATPSLDNWEEIDHGAWDSHIDEFCDFELIEKE